MSVTQSQLAKHLGLSQGTVSYAFSPDSKIHPLTRARVLEAARKLGYRPNSAARAMVSRRTRNVGVVIHSLGLVGGHHAYDTVSGINSVIEPAGYTTCLVQMHDVEQGENGLARVFREQALDGMIVHAALMPRVRDRLTDVVGRVIWCDSGVHDPEDCLWRDELAAGRLVATAAADAGWREVLWLAGGRRQNRPYSHRARRYVGARSVLQRRGVHWRTALLHERPFTECRKMADLVRRIGCVLCSDYKQASALVHMLAASGMSAGNDYALATADDLGTWQTDWPTLSRATFDRYEMGQIAARMLLQRLDDPETPVGSVVMKPTWHSGSNAVFNCGPTLVRKFA